MANPMQSMLAATVAALKPVLPEDTKFYTQVDGFPETTGGISTKPLQVLVDFESLNPSGAVLLDGLGTLDMQLSVVYYKQGEDSLMQELEHAYQGSIAIKNAEKAYQLYSQPNWLLTSQTKDKVVGSNLLAIVQRWTFVINYWPTSEN